MKIRGFRQLVALLILGVGCTYSTIANACTPLQMPPEEADKLIDKAAFIGMVRVLEIERREAGEHESVTFEPFFVYSAKEDFDLHSKLTVKFEGWSSCQQTIHKYGLHEFVVFQNDDGTYKMGNNMERGNLGKYGWDKLRSQVRYIKPVEAVKNKETTEVKPDPEFIKLLRGHPRNKQDDKN